MRGKATGKEGSVFLGNADVSVGANGIEGNFKREAVAGLYAEKSRETEGTRFSIALPLLRSAAVA